MRVAIIVVAAGSGTRLEHAEPKAFVELRGVTILERALRGVFESSEPAQVIVEVGACDASDGGAAQISARCPVPILSWQEPR